MSKLQLNEEQLAVIKAGKETRDNLLVQALAGGAKTTTLVELAKELRGTNLALAFNKKNAVDMATRMPPNMNCSTLNSLGHRAWGDKLGRRLTVKDSKVRDYIKAEIEKFDKSEHDDLWDDYAVMAQAVNMAKAHGHVPDRFISELPKCTPLMNNDMVIESLDERLTVAQEGIILRVLERSFESALQGVIDFSDQLLMPAVMPCSFAPFTNVLVDEAQDLSELNHALLAKVARQRLIAVGDSAQAIYAFRGAHEDSMSLLKDRFDMKELWLSTSFRCPSAIVEHVHWRVGHMQAWEGNPNNPGSVNKAGVWDWETLPENCAVICRNNAPLCALAIYLLKHGRRSKMWGRDVASGLIKDLKNLGPENMKREDAIEALGQWYAAKFAKCRTDSAKSMLGDRRECLLVFLENSPMLGAAMAVAEEVFSQEGNVELMTGHKSKGAEFNEVFFLDEDLLSDEGQDPNLRYVIATRAKRNLTYIYSRDLVR